MSERIGEGFARVFRAAMALLLAVTLSLPANGLTALAYADEPTQDAGEGLNCATGEYGKMIQMGVNDPVKVTRTALQSASSVAALILITEATINEIPKDPDPAAAAAAAAAAGAGGMY